MTQMPRMIALCAVAAGVDILRQLELSGLTLSAAIGLAAKPEGRPEVAGWMDLEQIEGIVTPRDLARTYDLSAPEDRAMLERLAPELVLVIGWQRLIPDWLIGLAQHGAWGVHGSPQGIASGRGRSPQNWAIIMGASKFELSLFRITPGIDEGPVLSKESFELTQWDDIATSYAKTALATASMIVEALRSGALYCAGEPQPDAAFYYPQRLPDDGWVDWALDSDSIARHCRALTRPYPGLQTAVHGNRAAIWRLQRFDDAPSEPGRVDAAFTDGSFIVGCGSGRVLVRDSDLSVAAGDLLDGRSFRETMETIINRHELRYPDLPIAQSILNLRDSGDA